MSMWQRREDLSPSLSSSLFERKRERDSVSLAPPSIPFGCIFLHQQLHTPPHAVTTHRSRSKVSSSSFTFTTLPPCTPSTRRALLFYYSTRPRRVRLFARRIYRETSLCPSPSFFFLHLPPSPFSHLLRGRRSLLE